MKANLQMRFNRCRRKMYTCGGKGSLAASSSKEQAVEFTTPPKASSLFYPAGIHPYIFIAQYVADTLEKHLKKLKCFLSQCFFFCFSSSILCEYLSMFAYKHERINMFACSDMNFVSVFVVIYMCGCVSLFSVPTHMCFVLNSYICINTLVFSLN